MYNPITFFGLLFVVLQVFVIEKVWTALSQVREVDEQLAKDLLHYPNLLDSVNETQDQEAPEQKKDAFYSKIESQESFVIPHALKHSGFAYSEENNAAPHLVNAVRKATLRRLTIASGNIQ